MWPNAANSQVAQIKQADSWSNGILNVWIVDQMAFEMVGFKWADSWSNQMGILLLKCHFKWADEIKRADSWSNQTGRWMKKSSSRGVCVTTRVHPATVATGKKINNKKGNDKQSKWKLKKLNKKGNDKQSKSWFFFICIRRHQINFHSGCFYMLCFACAAMASKCCIRR